MRVAYSPVPGPQTEVVFEWDNEIGDRVQVVAHYFDYPGESRDHPLDPLVEMRGWRCAGCRSIETSVWTSGDLESAGRFVCGGCGATGIWYADCGKPVPIHVDGMCECMERCIGIEPDGPVSVGCATVGWEGEA